jgi:ketosteroid isomerase-like protein
MSDPTIVVDVYGSKDAPGAPKKRPAPATPWLNSNNFAVTARSCAGLPAIPNSQKQRRALMKRTILLAVVSTLILASYQYSPAASSKGNDEAEIKALEQRIVDGAKARDVDAVMKNYVDDDSLLVFDVIPPRQYVGAKALSRNWQGFLDGFDGTITLENSDMEVVSDGKLAYAHYIAHVAGKGKDGNPIDMAFRLTDVLRKVKGKWLIVHEHVSVPVDVATGKADLTSKP